MLRHRLRDFKVNCNCHNAAAILANCSSETCNQASSNVIWHLIFFQIKKSKTFGNIVSHSPTLSTFSQHYKSYKSKVLPSLFSAKAWSTAPIPRPSARHQLKPKHHGPTCCMVCLFTPPYAGIKLYCLVTEASVCVSEQLARGRTRQCIGWA